MIARPMAHVEGSILPASEEITPFIGDPHQYDNERCPCSRSHLLHSQKDILVNYRGVVWSWKCAFTEQVDTLVEKGEYWRDQYKRIKKERDKLHSTMRETRISHSRYMKIARQVVSRYENDAAHLDTCQVIDLAAAGRDYHESDCSCGLLERVDKYKKELETLLTAEV